MTNQPTPALAEPRIVQGSDMTIAGLRGHFSFDNLGGLPALWQRFRPLLGQLPVRADGAYGLCLNTDATGFDYIAGVEVAPGTALPPDMSEARVPARRYAVFWHAAHVSSVRGTFMAIFNDWLPRSGHRAADAPVFERYDQRFDPDTGTGGFELWIPLAA